MAINWVGARMSASINQTVVAVDKPPKVRLNRGPMRICMVCGTYPPARCGIADGLRILSEALAARGAEVSVVTSSYLGISESQGNPRVLPVIKSWRLSNTLQAIKAILATRPDIVHFQFPNGEYGKHPLCNFLVPLTKLARSSTRVVVTFHEFLRREEIGWYKFLYISRILVSVVAADAVILVAPEYKEVLHLLWPRSRRIPCRIVRNASNIPRSKLDIGELAALRRKIGGIAPGTILLGYFGFTHRGKGFEGLLEVVKLLKLRGKQIVLLVLGELSCDNEYHRQLLTQISEWNLGNDIRLLGRTDAIMVADYLAACDAAIFPFKEGVHAKAGSILAAAEQGVFTVTTSTIRNGFVEAENIYYAQPQNAQEMADAVLRYAGRKVPRGLFPWRTSDEVANDNFEVYRDLLARRESPYANVCELRHK